MMKDGLPSPVAVGGEVVGDIWRDTAAVVIVAVEGEGVEGEGGVGVEAVTERGAVDDVERYGGEIGGDESGQGIWIRAVGEAVAFEGAGGEGQAAHGFMAANPLDYL